MDNDDKFALRVIVVVAVAVVVIALGGIINDTLEKKWAFGKNLCQMQTIGSHSWVWQPCNK